MSILDIGARALLANQTALQTIGNNIANVNTPGYSRQSAVMATVPGQFTGGGYVGKGVQVLTIERTYSEFLTKQAALFKSVAAADTTRHDNLHQLENVFHGGTDGLGAAVSNMFNAFSDIVSAPSDLTARSVVLTRADEAANRFQAAASHLHELRLTISEQIKSNIAIVNALSSQIASTNSEIAKAIGSGQLPNDLLDQRDRLINELNKYIQTSAVPADDGTLSLFIGGSHSLVLGINSSPLSLTTSEFPGDKDQSKLAIKTAGATYTMDEAILGGGEIAGLLRFQNTDLVAANNLLGRMALAIGTRINEQQVLGLDLDGNAGTALFSMSAIPKGFPASGNTGTGTLTIDVQAPPSSGTTSLLASNYQVYFSTATTGNITRLSDGVTVAFDLATANPILIDGLKITPGGGPVDAGDRFLIKPFSEAANSIRTTFSSPRGLAMASPITANMGTGNTGTLTLADLMTRSVPAPAAVTLTFTGSGTYTRSDTGATVYTYTPGQPIEYATAAPLNGWSLTLQGVPKNGDTYEVKPNTFTTLNAGNALSMLNLRDLAMFDGAPLTDGYASLIADIGTRVQSAKSAAMVSESIAVNIEKDRASIAGVNLDEEAAKMLQYQQAYQAAGKMLQISQNIFDTLIQSLGR